MNLKSNKRRAVFIDRDGVLNRAVVREGKPFPPSSVADVEIVSGVVESMRALKNAGFVLIVVSNQPDVARGTTTQATVEAINAYLAEQLPIDRFIMCYHDSSDGCSCRKPRPGMLLAGAREFDIDMSASFMVGDRWRDIEAGAAGGCKTIYIDYGYDEKRPQTYDYRVFSTYEAFSTILTENALSTIEGRSKMQQIEHLKVKIFADGADRAGMLEMYGKPYIKGLTTNPTLMRKAGITDYRSFAKEILAEIKEKPISFEVFSDDFAEMERQALEIAGWADNVYVKIPVTNTRQEPSYSLVKKLAAQKVKLNVTALTTPKQVRDVVDVLDPAVPSYVSVFAGRIADTGRDPVPLMAASVEILKLAPAAELIWASPRELLNIFQADAVGCHIITVTNDILKKLSLVGFDLKAYSLDTVRMFFNDALAAGYKF
jgi:transaldolase